MGNFRRDDSSRDERRNRFERGRKNFGSRDNYNRGRRGDRQMFKTICSNCGKDCEVPFNPRGDKPVYCSDCFEKMGNRGERGSFGKQGFNDRVSSDDKYKAQFESVNAKLDKILGLLQPKEEASLVEDVIDKSVKKKEIKISKSKKTSKEKSS